jgi:hypothetical protein
MGAVAMTRQGLLDALWWRDAEAAYARHPAGQARPRRDAAAASLVAASEGKEPVLFEATDVLSLLRAGKIAQEFKLKALYVGTGDEYRLRDQVAAMHRDLILKVDFQRPFRLDDDTEWLDVPLERLRRMDRAPSNPKWMKDAGVTFSFTTAGRTGIGSDGQAETVLRALQEPPQGDQPIESEFRFRCHMRSEATKDLLHLDEDEGRSFAALRMTWEEVRGMTE